MFALIAIEPVVSEREIMEGKIVARSYIFGFEKLFEVFAFDMVTPTEAGDADVKVHLRQCERQDAARQSGSSFSNASGLGPIKVFTRTIQMSARRMTVVDDFTAKLVFVDVALLVGRIIRPYIQAKEDGIAQNTARALRTLYLQLHWTWPQPRCPARPT